MELPERRLDERRCAVEGERSLPSPVAEEVIGWLDGRCHEVAIIVRGARFTGLRLEKELLPLRVRDVDIAAGLVYVRRGKGGLPRVCPVAGRYLAELAALVEGKAPDDHVYPQLQPAKVRFWVRKAFDAIGWVRAGVHAFRSTYAAERMAELGAAGYPEAAARRIVSEWLGHGRLSASYAYVRGHRREEDCRYSAAEAVVTGVGRRKRTPSTGLSTGGLAAPLDKDSMRV